MRLINKKPGPALAIFLSTLPFLVIFVAYAIASHLRLLENPSDKLLPSPAKVLETAQRLLTGPVQRANSAVA